MRAAAASLSGGPPLCFATGVYTRPILRHMGLTWASRPASVHFEVAVPERARPGNVVGKVCASQDPVPIGEVGAKLKVSEAAACRATALEPMGTALRYNDAFISYASQDRLEVLRCLRVLPAAGVQYFQDLPDLRPGDAWETELFRRIDESDVMFLLWSTAARQSEWVEKERRYALAHKRDDFIRPVIIEGPPPVSPPPELSHLHFNDRVLYCMHASQ